jgi:hypothetical protein
MSTLARASIVFAKRNPKAQKLVVQKKKAMSIILRLSSRLMTRMLNTFNREWVTPAQADKVIRIQPRVLCLSFLDILSANYADTALIPLTR